MKSRLAERAGKSDAVMKEKTGRDWAKWVDVVDGAVAVEWSHRDIARHIEAEHGWTICCTVTSGAWR